MLRDAKVMAMAAVKDIEEARKFYGEVLGLTGNEDNPGGVSYMCGGSELFVYPSQYAGTNQATTATWEVSDIKAVVDELKSKGVDQWEHYEFPGAEHDGEVHIMGTTKAAWFRDPSGNILGLGEAA